ncbi:conserved hypothetical protein [Uncinocarpus reesii 1704]|uniref:RING-type domain-containing protein n=1 Tax=Uncinocarpus reesii (strain UAMH 1704) TaxID=336963 RepID=C4JT14_UNCRE|nr:uncharacterized protein UREG_05603 [Uncinocarpus reesii 1704]EEP80761.1 conserved hypothetical protein [Uncinocarpus reesii 1704]
MPHGNYSWLVTRSAAMRAVSQSGPGKRKREANAETAESTAGTTPTKTKRARTAGRGEAASDVNVTPTRKRKGTRSTPRKQGVDDDIEVVQEEKRLRPFRKKAPQTYLTKLARATTQRMFVVKRQREETTDGLEESVHIVGTTGNVYKVVIGKVLCNVLKVKDYLQYQLAFLSSELCDIFDNAPLSPVESASNDGQGKRKPIDGDCPICFMEFDAANDEVVWCKAACGNNIHKACFQQWVASQAGKEVRCVYCRSPWEGDKPDIQSLLETATVSEEGYLNVAGGMGLSQERGRHTSLYTPFLFFLLWLYIGIFS